MTISAFDARRRNFLPPHRWHGICCCCLPLVLGAALVMVTRQAWVGKGLKAKGLMKG
jgi:hypothetical protein